MAKFIKNYNLEEWRTLINFFQQSQSEQKDVLSLNILKPEKNNLTDNSDKLFEDPFVLKDVLVNGINIKDQIQKANKDRFYKILESLHEECEEEGFKIFDEKTRTNARQILNFLCENFSECDFDIYPTEDREIDIYYNPEKGRGILITCDSDGNIAYFKTNDKDSRYRCQDIESFPFKLLHKEIESLKRPKILSFEENPTVLLQQDDFKIREVSSEYKIKIA